MKPAIFWGGLLCGILDITAAFINAGLRGASPVRVLQSIASGLLGADSYKGGLVTAALGAVLHFLIAFTAATVYFVASRKVDFLVQQAVVSGLLYGIAVYFFMYYIVLPLSAVRKVPFSFTALITGLTIHMLCVGLPLALAVRRYSK
jgi:uncharacterized membrane protein YagU involved in acid resistance